MLKFRFSEEHLENANNLIIFISDRISIVLNEEYSSNFNEQIDEILVGIDMIFIFRMNHPKKFELIINYFQSDKNIR